jgi:hypothetical protein
VIFCCIIDPWRFGASDGKPTSRQRAHGVIGGSVIGCSVAIHLAKLGWRDVVLLE